MLGLGVSASAQYSFTGDFEEGYTTAIYKQFGGGSRTAAAACNGGFGGQLALSSSTPETGYMVDLAQIGQTGNGQKVDVSVSYKKGSGLTGSVSLAYFVLDSVSNLWTIVPFGSPVALTSAATTTCTPLTGTIPSGAIEPGKTYGIGVWVTRTASTGNVFVDDITVTQEVVSTVPACTQFSAPVDGSTVSAGNFAFEWAAAPTAVNYKLTVGTSAGASDFVNTTVSGNKLNVSLAPNTTYFAKVVPSNLNGDASGCTEISFTTNSQISYCGPLTTNQPAAVFPISSVNFAGNTNASSAASGAVTPYEDFTTVKFDVDKGATYPLQVKGTTNGSANNGWAMSVFIDWNGDGDFNDAGESYFNTTATMIRKAGVTDNPVTLVGNIAVPADVTVGEKRMRVKYNFSGTTLHTALQDGCSQMGNGQAEDYTLNVKEATAVPACTTITTPVSGATGVVANPTVINWEMLTGVQGYKVYLGTTSGGTEVLNGVTVNNNTLSISLDANKQYFVKVVPFNTVGDATGCAETSFTTGNYVYCAATATSASYEKISQVTFAGIDNATTSTAGYEDFTSSTTILGKVEQSSSNSITVAIKDYDNDYTSVWIDFNQNGIFEESEKTPLTNAASATGTIQVPADAKLGVTRMRVRMSYNAAPAACGSTTFGQVEDYNVQIFEPGTLAVANTAVSAVAVYPNPFHDVLRISDVKDVKSVSVHDMTGRNVKTLAPAAELNLSSLQQGVYIVNLQMKDGSVKSVKVIKK